RLFYSIVGKSGYPITIRTIEIDFSTTYKELIMARIQRIHSLLRVLRWQCRQECDVKLERIRSPFVQERVASNDFSHLVRGSHNHGNRKTEILRNLLCDGLRQIIR